jgi:hypothetical protein
MRSTPSTLLDLIEQPKTASARITLRKARPVFSMSHVVLDGLGLSDPSALDLCVYNNSIVRVVNYLDGLYTQAISATSDVYDPAYIDWTDRAIALYPDSRPGIENGWVWYQKTDGTIARRHVDDWTTEIVEVVVSSACAIAPLGERAYVQYLAGSYLSISDVRNQTLTVWDGRVYGDIQTPQFFDAVELNGCDYLYAMDRNAGRILEMKRVNSTWGAFRPVVPIDAIDSVYGLTLRYATVIDGRVALTARYVRTSDGDPIGMDVCLLGPEQFTFGRDVFVTEQNIGSKLLVLGDTLVYLGVSTVLEAENTYLYGYDNSALKLATGDIGGFTLQESEGRSGNIEISLSTELDTTIAVSGSECTLEMAYNDVWMQLAHGEVAVHSRDSFTQGKDRKIRVQSKAAKRISQWFPEQGIYMPSQARMYSDPAQMDQVIRASGEWETEAFGDITPLKLKSLNTTGVLYSVARASRGGSARARFYIPAGTDFYPRFGVGINYYIESRQEAADRLGLDYNDVTKEQYGHNGIFAVWGREEHGGNPGIGLYLYDNSEATLLTSVSLALSSDTWYWLQVYFVDGYIRVDYRLGDETEPAWTNVLTHTYSSDVRVPWKREDYGRGAVLLENGTLRTSSFAFRSDSNVVPVSDNSIFAPSGTCVVDDEVIDYDGQSLNIVPVGPLNVLYNAQALNQLSGQTGYEIMLQTEGPNYSTDYYNNCAAIVVDGPGKGAAFTVVGYDPSVGDAWIPSGTYTSPDKWQDHIGETGRGSWQSANARRIYVSENTAGVIGDGSVIKIVPALVVSQRGAQDTSAAAHDDGQAGVFVDAAIYCDLFGTYSQECDLSLEDSLCQIATMAGGEVDCQFDLDGDRTFGAWDVLAPATAEHTNFISDVGLPVLNDGDEIGVAFRSTTAYAATGVEPTGTSGYQLALQRSGSNYYLELSSLSAHTAIQKVQLWLVPDGTMRISVQDDTFSVWINDVFVHSFHDSAYDSGAYVGFYSNAAKTFSVHLSTLDDLVADITLGVQGNGMSAIGQIIQNRRVKFRSNADGHLFFYRRYDNVGTLPDIVASSSRIESDSVYARVRAEGLYIVETADFDLVRTHGNMLKTINVPFEDTINGLLKEADRDIAEQQQNADVTALETVLHPSLQPGDRATILVDGEYRDVRIVSVAMRLGYVEDKFDVSGNLEVIPHA